MTATDQERYVDTIANMTKRLMHYGKADIVRISFYKLALKYKPLMRATDVDANGIAMTRKLDLLMKRIEVDCPDIIK